MIKGLVVMPVDYLLLLCHTSLPLVACHVVCAGVADGVGGWDEKGVCSGVFARQLMKNVERAAKVVSRSPTAPIQCLTMAHSALPDLKGALSPLPASACVPLCHPVQSCNNCSQQVFS